MKRVGGPLLWISGALAAAVLSWFGWIYWQYGIYHPVSANVDPLVNSILQERGAPLRVGEAEMRACCFAKGRDKASVLKRLQSSGFETDEPTEWDETFFGPEYLASGVTIYSRFASKFPCMDMFYVAVEFDENDRLVKSEGERIPAACL